MSGLRWGSVSVWSADGSGSGDGGSCVEDVSRRSSRGWGLVRRSRESSSASWGWSRGELGSWSESSERLAIRRPPRALDKLMSPFMVMGLTGRRSIERGRLEMAPVPCKLYRPLTVGSA